ncbi:hypothetical protein [Caballeronia sp. DA-9]|uniref:hypothetical protein n=1 Tax=Caballeronia sp. DA-9 TaxID=3436237 RepID=UPI003F67CBD5
MFKQRHSHARRRALQTLAALASVPFHAVAATAVAVPRSGDTGTRRMTQLIGSNGWAGAPADIAMWHQMGISWGRDVAGPGQPDSPRDAMRIDRTGPSYDSNLPPVLLSNNRNGFRSLLLLAYTPGWNATVADDSKSAPVDVNAWTQYVDAVVRKYSAPPYNVRYFQIWNEAAGRLSGGLQQATFWHGPAAGGKDGVYDRAMQDYVERIHIPAARIIRKYRCYIVYGGWPDQGGVDTYIKWLEYRSPVVNARMIDWVDYLDIHYMKVAELDPLYERYVRNGPARGIWQTEIGDRYMEDPHYLARYFFDFAVWALDRNWDDPDKYVSMVFHWDGVEAFRLTQRGNPRKYTVSGRALVVLNRIVPGALAPVPVPLKFGPDVAGGALYSDKDLVFQVAAPAGWRTVSVPGLKAPVARQPDVRFIDALTGQAAPASDVALDWDGGALNIRFKVPANVNGAPRKPPEVPVHLAYIVVSSRQAA